MKILSLSPHFFRPSLVFLTLGVLASCASKSEEKKRNPYKIPEQLQGNSGELGTAENPIPVGELKAVNEGGVKYGGFELPSDADIVWSDESKPDADIVFEKPFLKKEKVKGDWEVSFTDARRKAQRTGKPVLMWFTDNGPQPSPICKILSRELFSTQEYKDWAKEKVVSLRLDLSAGQKGMLSSTNNNDSQIRKQEYLEDLKKQYKVMGLPTVILLSPSGEVIEKFRGYKSGEPEFYWGRMKHTIAVSEREREVWRAKMGKKGYREWTGTNGVSLFAKLVRYNKGEMMLIEPDGNRVETQEDELSFADQLWITAEKQKRGL